ncbi:MAG: YitT family protein [Chitinophagaceae bacterium]|nr:YitT family protein [Chitinophagaceae bacterium]
MNPHFQQLISQTVVRQKDKGQNTPRKSSKYQEAKSQYRVRKTFLINIKDSLLILIGIFSAGFGLKSFLLPSDFIDGGATGISLLLAEITGLPIYFLILLVNIPFIFFGYHQIGKTFTIKTIVTISALAIVLAFVEYPIVTSDKLLVAVFGGFFLGAGIGLTVRGGAVLDGTEVLAIFISKKTNATIGDIIAVINVVIFSTAAYFLSIESALYSMLTYIAASKTVDYIIEGIEEYTGVTIISPKSEEIRQVITEKLGRGVTEYKGSGGFGKRGYTRMDMNIIFTVVTRLEISRLRTEIELIDPNAFVVMHSIKDTKGGMIKKRPLKN